MKKLVSRLVCACGAVIIRHRDKATRKTVLVCWRWPECERTLPTSHPKPRQPAAVGRVE